MEQDLKEKLTFHDQENNLIEVNIEIKEGMLSMSGNYGGGCGQMQDSIKPANKEQIRLLEIWNNWHLNDMNVGTEKQTEALKGKTLSYEEAVKFLKKKRLYSDKGHKYGVAWLKRELPVGLSTELKALCETIRGQEVKRKEELKGEWAEEPTPNIKALALSLDLSPKEAEQDITTESETEYTYCGTSYFVGTEEEATERAKESLDESLWKDAVANDRTTESFEDWQEWVIEQDGLGSILNSWDGSEDTQTIDGETYYIIRM